MCIIVIKGREREILGRASKKAVKLIDIIPILMICTVELQSARMECSSTGNGGDEDKGSY